MSSIDKNGTFLDNRVIQQQFAGIEHGALTTISALVIHQTDTSTLQQTLNSYAAGGNGAHFLIDKNGQIYQTANLKRKCWHVGAYLKSKCLAIDIKTCTNEPELKRVLATKWPAYKVALDAYERNKPYPERYPVNSDSIGIEIVGKSLSRTTYEPIDVVQEASLKWLVSELVTLLSLTDKDIYKHPDVSYKNSGEAASAVWR